VIIVKTKTLKIIKKDEIRSLTGLSNTTQFEQIKSGLFPAYIKLSARSVGLFQHEVEIIISARAAQMHDDEIREVVQQLHRNRQISAFELINNI
jgi:prophage regulatory protein